MHDLARLWLLLALGDLLPGVIWCAPASVDVVVLVCSSLQCFAARVNATLLHAIVLSYHRCHHSHHCCNYFLSVGFRASPARRGSAKSPGAGRFLLLDS
jgi:hypothetical protein